MTTEHFTINLTIKDGSTHILRPVPIPEGKAITGGGLIALAMPELARSQLALENASFEIRIRGEIIVSGTLNSAVSPEEAKKLQASRPSGIFVGLGENGEIQKVLYPCPKCGELGETRPGPELPCLFCPGAIKGPYLEVERRDGAKARLPCEPGEAPSMGHIMSFVEIAQKANLLEQIKNVKLRDVAGKILFEAVIMTDQEPLSDGVDPVLTIGHDGVLYPFDGVLCEACMKSPTCTCPQCKARPQRLCLNCARTKQS